MQKLSVNINRIIDANINRAKEGLRVCEEITRFILNSQSLTLELKEIRHRIDSTNKYLPSKAALLKEREVLNDVGRNINTNEFERKNLSDIFFANVQRVKESMRVLEEFTKFKNTKAAIEFKKLRYKIYEIEKKTITKITSLRNNR